MFFPRESGTVVPLLTGAASAPQRPSHAGAGNAPHKVIPRTVKFGGGGGPEDGVGGGLHWKGGRLPRPPPPPRGRPASA